MRHQKYIRRWAAHRQPRCNCLANISGAPKHPTPEQLKTAQPLSERRPTWTLTAGFAFDLVRVAGGDASTALHRGGSRFHLVRRESYRPGRLTAHLTQGSLCLGVGATLREDRSNSLPRCTPPPPSLYLNLLPPPPRPGEGGPFCGDRVILP